MKRALLLFAIVAACGKKTAPPPPLVDASLPHEEETLPKLQFTPPIRASKDTLAGSYEGTMRISLGVMHTREHTASYGMSMNAKLTLAGDHTTLCLEGTKTSSSSISPYAQGRLPDGGRPPWRDSQSGPYTSKHSFSGRVTGEGAHVTIALTNDPSACGDAGAHATSTDFVLSCFAVERDVDAGVQPLIACQWSNAAPYEGPGLELTEPEDGGARSRDASDPTATWTWLLLGRSGIALETSKSWNTGHTLTIR